MTQFLAEDPEDFAQSTYNLTIYSELPFGDKISFYLIARSTETQKTSLLSIMAPVSLANNLRDFFSNDVQFSMRRIQSQNVVQ